MQRRLRVELLKLIHIPYILLVIDKEETSIPYIYNARMEECTGNWLFLLVV